MQGRSESRSLPIATVRCNLLPTVAWRVRLDAKAGTYGGPRRHMGRGTNSRLRALLGLNFALAPGHERTFASHRWLVTAVLGDTLPAGRYHFAAYTELNGELLVIRAGSVTLRRP